MSTAGSKPAGGPPSQPEEPRRVLVLSTEPLTGDEVRERIAADLDHEDGAVELDFVVPALIGSPIEHAMGDVDDARARAEEAVEASQAENLGGDETRLGHAEVGDSDPVLAIEDALNRSPADAIVIVTRPGDSARWLEGDLFERARQKFTQPIHHLEIEPNGSQRVVEEHRESAGTAEATEREVEGRSGNLPRFSARDLAGIAVAVIGTLIAIVIASSCDGDAIQRDPGTGGVGSDGSCVLAYIAAGAAALVNAAHVVGLTLFESVGYRGGWARFLSLSSLVGTPAAVLVAAIAVH
jgi:hypothetical protein